MRCKMSLFFISKLLCPCQLREDSNCNPCNKNDIKLCSQKQKIRYRIHEGATDLLKVFFFIDKTTQINFSRNKVTLA